MQIKITTRVALDKATFDDAVQHLEDAMRIIAYQLQYLQKERGEYAELAHLHMHEAKKWIQKIDKTRS